MNSVPYDNLVGNITIAVYFTDYYLIEFSYQQFLIYFLKILSAHLKVKFLFLFSFNAQAEIQILKMFSFGVWFPDCMVSIFLFHKYCFFFLTQISRQN